MTSPEPGHSSVWRVWKARLGKWLNWTPTDRFPRARFVFDFCLDLLAVATMNFGLRLFLVFISAMNTVMPIGDPDELSSYLPQHVRIIVTIVHMVSIVSISMSGICVLIKIVRSQARGL